MSSKISSKSPDLCSENHTIYTIQQRLNHARDRLRDNDSRLELSLRERNALLDEREAIQAEVQAASLCYRDLRDAGRLSEQAAGVVAEACRLWGVEG